MSGASLAGVRGLRALWACAHSGGTPDPVTARRERVLMSALRVGIGEILPFLYRERPGFDALCDWIVATAGTPDRDAIDRYHAWLDGAPPPRATRAAFDAIDAAAPALSDAEMAHWDAEGWVVLRGAIPREAAQAAEAMAWSHIGAHPDDPAGWATADTAGVWVDCFHHPLLDVARDSARVRKAFAQIWGTPDLWLTIDRMGFNPPEQIAGPFRGAPVHWDVSLERPIPFGTQAILYLTDTGSDGGGVRVVPGFHRRLDGWLDTLGDSDPRQYRFEDEVVPIAAGAGDLVIWRHELPHGASPNRAAWPRIVQYLNFFCADVHPNPIWR
ncbi:MAG: phytanoyl-CoA dioxygenase family protein [Pseudomonadota bacterium]